MNSKNCSQVGAKMFYDADRKWQMQCAEQLAITAKQDYAEKKIVIKPKEWFITIGFNHQTWDIPSCVKVIYKILSFDWVDSGTGVFELYRTNGEHPHVHLLLDLNQDLSKSKLLEKIWATAGIKKVVLKKPFIDIKVAEEYHHNYIIGIKKPEKMPYCERDAEWREQNKIPHQFNSPPKKEEFFYH